MMIRSAKTSNSYWMENTDKGLLRHGRFVSMYVDKEVFDLQIEQGRFIIEDTCVATILMYDYYGEIERVSGFVSKDQIEDYNKEQFYVWKSYKKLLEKIEKDRLIEIKLVVGE